MTCAGCALRPAQSAIILPPPDLLADCEEPALSGDPALDLVEIEKGRLCERADKAGLRLWADKLRGLTREAPAREWWRLWS